MGDLPDDARRDELVDASLAVRPPPGVVHDAAGLPASWRLERDPEPRLVVHRLAGTVYEVVSELGAAGPSTCPR